MPRILLVEDDDQLRPMLKLLLTTAGYEVWEARDGRGVGDLYEHHHPNLVITDLVMPDKDGLEVIMDLRRRDPKVRIIAMSGGGQGSAECYLKIARKLGAQRTLSKPFGNNEFLEAVLLVVEAEE